VWEQAKLPAGKILMPGVISHATNLVEHPTLVADRDLRYTAIVGRESVIAGMDCGLRRPGPRRTLSEPRCGRLSKGPRCVDVPLALVEYARGRRRVPSSGCRVRLLGCGRCRIQLAVTLLDPSGAEMALHCDADMVRTIVGARSIKFLPGLACSQSQDALAQARCAGFASR
jgi:hypothetical protein